MKISEIVKKYRDEYHLSQRQFADRCDISCAMVSMIEKEKNPHTNRPINISYDMFRHLASGMNMNIDELLRQADSSYISLPDEAPVASAPDITLDIIKRVKNLTTEELLELRGYISGKFNK